MILVASATVLLAIGGAERLRWRIVPVPAVDVPSAAWTLVNDVSDNGMLTDRSGASSSAVGWHAFTWTLEGGTHQCKDGAVNVGDLLLLIEGWGPMASRASTILTQVEPSALMTC